MNKILLLFIILAIVIGIGFLVWNFLEKAEESIEALRAVVREEAYFSESEQEEGMELDVWLCGENLIDERDGAIYSTVKIGEQCWMAENLNYDNNCENIVDLSKWHAEQDKGWCGYYYEYRNYGGEKITDEGFLYQWSAAMESCPSGWHLPTHGEWSSLIDFSGKDAADKIKTEWHCSIPGESHCGTSGFNALMSGFRTPVGGFSQRGSDGYFWSSSGNNSLAWIWSFASRENWTGRWEGSKSWSVSVRCLKD